MHTNHIYKRRTPELLKQAADSLTETKQLVDEFKQKFIEGLSVNYQGDDADDGMECPACGYEVARNDDYTEMRPKHCPECGTKLIYQISTEMGRNQA